MASSNISELEKALPQSVITYLQKINAVQRLKDIFSKERKTPSLVVDVVLFDEEGKLILIQRKNFPE
ncbi:MAG: hypothetical protein WCJ45_06540 [bacterium]